MGAYDQGMSGGAARLWWLLRHFGHPQVAVLAGGPEAWRGPLEEGEADVIRVDFAPSAPQPDTIEVEELARRLGEPGVVVVDARAPERYRGEVEPIDPVAGRIPGAVNVPYGTATSLPADVLEAKEIVVYCGSGITACVDLLALAVAGREDARLYAGSWSDGSSEGCPPSETRVPQPAGLTEPLRSLPCDSPGIPPVTAPPASSVAPPGACVTRDLCRFCVGVRVVAARHRHGFVRCGDAERVALRVDAMGELLDPGDRCLLGRHLSAPLGTWSVVA